MTDLTRLHAHEMAGLLRSGGVSSRELTEAHLTAAERDNRGAERLAHDRPRSGARGGRCRGYPAGIGAGGWRCGADGWFVGTRSAPPLLGIPVALKDLVSVAGGQCTAGSRILEGYIAPYDAHITERLREAGAVILGKTNMDEFAMGSSTEHSAYGPTANPWALDRVPGGSSGGSAAAVAAFHAPLSIGTDTGGSIRQPAALCGIVGMKPTYGRVSRYGIVAFASSLDQIGPFARDVRDAAALLHAVAGRDDRDSTSSPEPGAGRAAALPAGDDEAAGRLRGKRLGLPREYFVAGMEPGVEARVREAVAALEAAGATIEEVSLPHTDYGLATYYIVAPAEASANLARYDGMRYGPHHAEGDVLANYLATRGQRLRAGGQAPGHARDLRAVGRLLRRVLPQGAEGPDADQGRLRHAVGAGVRCPRRADLADGRVPVRRPAGRSRVDVPVGRVHPAGQHGRPARHLDPGRTVRWSAGRPAAHRRAVVGGSGCSGWPAATRRSPRAPTGGRWSLPASPPSTTPRPRRPPSARPSLRT